MKNKLKITFIYLLSFFYFNLITAVIGTEVYIVLKIEDEIVTNLDVIKEKNYLIALNNSLSQINQNQLEILAKNSIIKEKIKKKELIKYYDLEKASSILETLIIDLSKKLNFRNQEELNKYLLNFNLDIDEIKEKLKIETLWNQLIYDRFINQVSIDESKLRDNLKTEIEYNSNQLYEYNLSEILYELNANETPEQKYNLIIANIEESGFKNASNFYSISESSKFGGEIGWINKTQLSKSILKEIEKIEVGKLTQAIQVGSNFMILKINDKRKINKKINFDEELKKLIIFEKNKQLNQLSLIYFNKIKQNIFISEL
jgi:peptidyl-prolyl cis-trans isomerase SurA|tara:strand:+ start:150 stop:1097 length:948 start_codon:yes stop_codon:yes gene_type:complete